MDKLGHHHRPSSSHPTSIFPNPTDNSSSQPSGEHIHQTYGLHRLCSSFTHQCAHFPQYDDCHGRNRSFCQLWRSVGWMMSFAVALEGMTLVAYIVIIKGGRQKRETGWSILSLLLLLTGLVQCGSMAIVVCLLLTPFTAN
jgi:hypothetical protein